LSNPDKVLYPATGFTKGAVIRCYTLTAPALLSHVMGRPITTIRFPNGLGWVTPRMGEQLVEAIMTALVEQPITIPGTAAADTVPPRLADNLKTVPQQRKRRRARSSSAGTPPANGQLASSWCADRQCDARPGRGDAEISCPTTPLPRFRGCPP
jgi:hypothetical protein